MNKTKKMKKADARELMTGLLFIAPGLIGFIVFILIPVIFSLILTLTKWNFMEGFGGIKFNGIENFKRLFTDINFTSSFSNNFVFTAVSIPVLIILGLVLAAIMDKYIYGNSFIRVFIFIPYIASVVAVCPVWMVLMHPTFGPINQFLMSIGIENPPKWLADFQWALPSVIIVYVWQQVGYYVIVFMSGLKSISDDVYEAASIDGASPVRQFFSITIPLVSPTTFFLVTMGIIGSFKIFDHISVLTQGGPGTSTSVMAFYIYRKAFIDFDMGYANTLAWALFVLIFIVTIVQYSAQKKFTNE
ncbi:MAG: sugar ABC transporter permease [Bacillota bacterium]